MKEPYMKAKSQKMNKKISKKENTDYDKSDVSSFINKSRPLKFEDIGLALPPSPPTQVVSIRLPTELLNQLRAMGSQMDIPYQALIKGFLAEAVEKKSKKAA